MNKETNLLIKNDSIRSYFDEKSDKWYFSIVDVVGIIAHTANPRNYWKVLKNRLKKGQNELVTECNQLKMKAKDGKSYLTDTAPSETILKIITIVSKEYVPIFEQYFENLREDKIEKIVKEKIIDIPFSHSSLDLNNSYPQTEESKTIEEEKFMLLIDGYHTHDSIIIKCFVAGISIENILISVTSKTLTINGMREKEPDITKENYLIEELLWCRFSRKIELPYEIEKEEMIIDEYRGLLTIKLPIINKLESKKIKIKSI